ncbi:threonine synthase-like 2 [Petaurus breviceps papuanus]|uniref:threonine synthase-like 2 n=1 Tax=Petaurus breviceps papuanus TaxID=3040969 RepID=UPI0036D9B072
MHYGATYLPNDCCLIDRGFSKFRHRDVVHLSRMKNGLNVLELWHGVTYAFKDLSMSCTGQFLQYFLEKRQKHVTIVVGTSGDTGSSAIESVRGAKNTDIIVLLPLGRCSKIQELQMTTVIEDNVHVFGVEGDSDELDEPIKDVFADAAFAGKHNLMSLNSLNWSRVLVQMAHYFFAYFQCAPSMDVNPLPPVEVVVPTGAAGNLAAGCIARQMGLPICLATVVNHNDIVHRAVQHGDFSLSGNTSPTLASAMDIQVPYNMERVFWLLSGSDSRLVRALMEQFDSTKKLHVPKELHAKISETISSQSVSDEDIIQTMRHCWEENHYLLCPHSAVAVCYHYKRLACEQTSLPRCCLAPASAAKFPDAVLRAQLVPEIPEDIRALEHMKTQCTTLRRGDDWTRLLRNKIEDLSQQRKGGVSSQG